MSGEMFTLLGWAWDVDLAVRLARRHPVRQAAARTLAGVKNFIRVDPDHAATADLTRPILIVPLPCAPEPGNRLVIDGWHRIHRALTEGLDELPAILLNAADERTCRIHGGCP
jgi:hypothetical protein